MGVNSTSSSCFVDSRNLLEVALLLLLGLLRAVVLKQNTQEVSECTILKCLNKVVNILRCVTQSLGFSRKKLGTLTCMEEVFSEMIVYTAVTLTVI